MRPLRPRRTVRCLCATDSAQRRPGRTGAALNERDMLAVIGLEKLLAVERATVETGSP